VVVNFCYFMCILLLLGRVFWLLFIFVYLGVKIGVFVTYVWGVFREQILDVLLLCAFLCICLLYVGLHVKYPLFLSEFTET
jgi:hypothetical protein